MVVVVIDAGSIIPSLSSRNVIRLGQWMNSTNTSCEDGGRLERHVRSHRSRSAVEISVLVIPSLYRWRNAAVATRRWTSKRCQGMST